MTGSASYPPILHIGFPKTGSSFLQSDVFPRLRNYEFTLGTQVQESIATEYYEDPRSLFGAESKERGLLFSNEGVLNFTDHWASGTKWARERWTSSANVMRFLKDNGQLAIVVRRQDQLAESLLRADAHRYEGRWDRIFVDFPARFVDGGAVLSNRHGRHTTEQLDFHSWVMMFATVLGRERVHVFVFEDFVHEPERFFGNLGRLLGEDLSWAARLREPRNVSPPTSVVLPRRLAALRRLKAIAPEPLTNLARQMFSRDLHVDETRRMKLLDVYRKGNEALSATFGLGLERYGYC